MKINASKIIFSVFGLFLVLFIVYNAVGLVFDPYKTETVQNATVNQTINATAIVLRKENVITSDKSGVKVYGAKNGTKVAKGATVVEYYDSEDAVALKKQIDTLEYKISRLEEIDTQNRFYAADLDTISLRIKENLYQLLNNVDNNDFADSEDYESNILYYLCQNSLATGRTSDYSAQIEEYKSKLSELKNQFESSGKNVKTDESGYFVNEVDGYENAVDFDKITTMTVADYDNIQPAKVDSNAVGKVVSDTQWYMVAKLPLEDSHLISAGSKLDIILPLSTAEKVSVTVEAVNIDYSTSQVVAVFGCSNMNEELSTIRNEEVQIVVNNYTGLRVSKKAVRSIDGEKGVYVKLGSVIKFRKIDIAYSSDEYVIVNSDYTGDNLKIYDDVIIKGKNLNG